LIGQVKVRIVLPRRQSTISAGRPDRPPKSPAAINCEIGAAGYFHTSAAPPFRGSLCYLRRASNSVNHGLRYRNDRLVVARAGCPVHRATCRETARHGGCRKSSAPSSTRRLVSSTIRMGRAFDDPIAATRAGPRLVTLRDAATDITRLSRKRDTGMAGRWKPYR
jgi:hypothetical protein